MLKIQPNIFTYENIAQDCNLCNVSNITICDEGNYVVLFPTKPITAHVPFNFISSSSD